MLMISRKNRENAHLYLVIVNALFLEAPGLTNYVTRSRSYTKRRSGTWLFR
jgi:hypothetical protein